jgi:hypothetical protein
MQPSILSGKKRKKTQKDFSLFRAVIVGKKKRVLEKSSTSTVNHRILRCMALPGGRRLPSNIYQNVTTALQGMFFKFVFFLSLSHFKYPPDKSRSVYSLVCFSDDCETPKKICVQVRSPEDRHLYRCLNGNSLSKHCAAAKLHSSWCCPNPIHTF